MWISFQVSCFRCLSGHWLNFNLLSPILSDFASYEEILPQTPETSDEIRRVQTRARELIMQWIANAM